MTDKNFTFYLGTHVPNWLWRTDVRHPLFVSNRTLGRYKKLKKANVRWCLDSGGFTELGMFGTWLTTPYQYVQNVFRYWDEVGSMDWASPQDWMCEPQMLKKTGKTVKEHQHLTCHNFVLLRQLAPDMPIIPVLQGWMPDDYLQHAKMYSEYGVGLNEEPTVGVGSVCRRAKVDGMKQIFDDLSNDGLRLHGFGLKKDGIKLFGDSLQSSDSMAWSFGARMAGRKGVYSCGTKHDTTKNCANCIDWAQMWADKVLTTRMGE